MTLRRHEGTGLRQRHGAPCCWWNRGLSCVRRESWLRQDDALVLTGWIGGCRRPPLHTVTSGDLLGILPAPHHMPYSLEVTWSAGRGGGILDTETHIPQTLFIHSSSIYRAKHSQLTVSPLLSVVFYAHFRAQYTKHSVFKPCFQSPLGPHPVKLSQPLCY